MKMVDCESIISLRTYFFLLEELKKVYKDCNNTIPRKLFFETMFFIIFIYFK